MASSSTRGLPELCYDEQMNECEKRLEKSVKDVSEICLSTNPSAIGRISDRLAGVAEELVKVRA